MINFETIPSEYRTGGTRIEFDSSKAKYGAGTIENRVLIVGQLLGTGSAAALTRQPISGVSEAIAKFGQGSMLARQIAAFRNADKSSEIVAVGLADAVGASAATSTLTLTGPASAAGEIALMIAGVRVPVAVASAAAATTIATAIAAAVNAKADLPVTAAVGEDPNEHVVTLTARNKGTTGNSIDVRHSHYKGEALPAGVGLTIVAMSGGAGDPEFDDVFALLGDEEYRTIVFSLLNSSIYAVIKPELDDRWGAERMLENVAYFGKSGTQGELATFGASFNAALGVTLGGGKSPTWSPEQAAILGAICGYYTAIDPARPTRTLTLTGMIAPKQEDQFTRAQRETLLHDGIATYYCDTDGTCRIERSITMYQRDANGQDDTAYLDVETVTTVSYLRKSLRSRFSSKYPRHKLADDGTKFGSGQAIITPSAAKAEIIALAVEDWEPAGLIEDLDDFKANLIVERDANDPDRLNALVPPNIVNGFRAFAASIQFRL